MADYEDRTNNTTRYETTGASEARARQATHQAAASHSSKNILDWLSLVLLIVGGLNWGLVGLFDIDLVASLFGQGSTISRAVYILVGLAAIWGFALMRLNPPSANR